MPVVMSALRTTSAIRKHRAAPARNVTAAIMSIRHAEATVIFTAESVCNVCMKLRVTIVSTVAMVSMEMPCCKTAESAIVMCWEQTAPLSIVIGTLGSVLV